MSHGRAHPWSVAKMICVFYGGEEMGAAGKRFLGRAAEAMAVV